MNTTICDSCHRILFIGYACQEEWLSDNNQGKQAYLMSNQSKNETKHLCFGCMNMITNRSESVDQFHRDTTGNKK